MFELDVEATAPVGGVISNQATVTTDELPNTLTDGDGNPATGPEPTVVVVGGAEQLSIDKQVSVLGGGPALLGGTLEYLVTVRNVGSAPATNVVLSDPDSRPSTTYVAGSATMNGATAGVVGRRRRAAHGRLWRHLWRPPGRRDGDPPIPGRRRPPRWARRSRTSPRSPGASAGMADASVTITVGGTPGVGTLGGRVWHDQDFDDVFGGATDAAQSGWTVQLLRNGAAIQTTTTDASGLWLMRAIPPNDVSGDAYAVRFAAPGASPATASMGATVSPYTDGQQEVTAIVVASGGFSTELNLPVTPNGLVYESVARTPVAGATLEMRAVGSGSPLPAVCFADPNQQGQVTPPSGWYKFDLVFGPTCPATDGGDVPDRSRWCPRAAAISDALSLLIPPQIRSRRRRPSRCRRVRVRRASTPFPPPARTVRVRVDANVPSEPSGATRRRTTSSTSPSAARATGTNQIFNNAIPIDPVLGGAVSDSQDDAEDRRVSGRPRSLRDRRRQHPRRDALADLEIIDRFPAGFRYVEGSARHRRRADRADARRQRADLDRCVSLAPSTPSTIVLLLAVGAGVTEGEFVNRAFVLNTDERWRRLGGSERDGPCHAGSHLRLHRRHRQGLRRSQSRRSTGPGRAAVWRTSDSLPCVASRFAPIAHGRFHITCALVPNERRGSNFVLKLDDRTLPSGYRMTTRQTRVARATRGKTLEVELRGVDRQRGRGARPLGRRSSTPGDATLRTHWASRLPLLLDELEKGDSILRLSYLADREDDALVRARLRAVEELVREGLA